MHLYPIEGAVRRVPKEATAWNTRDATWSMVIAGIDADPKQADALKTWGRAYWTAIHPFNLEGAYVNFMMDDEVQATYGENYQRLAFCESEETKFFGRRMAALLSRRALPQDVSGFTGARLETPKNS